MTKEAEQSGRRITIRVTDELHERIVRLAARDRRAVEAWVKLAVEDAVTAAESSTTKKR